MVELINRGICECFESILSETTFKNFYSDILKKVPNSFDSKKLADILIKYHKNTEEADSTKIKLEWTEYILTTKLERESIYILDKNSWEDTNSMLIIEKIPCGSDKSDLSIEFTTMKNQFSSEDFELSYKPLNVLSSYIPINKLSGECCAIYHINDSNNLSIHPNNLSLTLSQDLVNKLGEFKFSEYRLECNKSKLNIRGFHVKKTDNTLRVDLGIKFSREFSVDMLQKTANDNYDILSSLLSSK